MIRSVFLALSAVLAASNPVADTSARHWLGALVVDARGKPVGKIDRVISGPNGKPMQVLVRVDRILRTLPIDALAPSGPGYASVLSRAEIAALPPSD